MNTQSVSKLFFIVFSFWFSTFTYWNPKIGQSVVQSPAESFKDTLHTLIGNNQLDSIYTLPEHLHVPLSTATVNTISLEVRVLIKRLQDQASCSIQSENPLLIYNMHQKTPYRVDGNYVLNFKSEGVALTLNGKLLRREALCIQPLSDHLHIDGALFKGKVFLVPYEKGWYLINQVPVEDYVCSVLRTESWPGWPLEVNKAFAIAIRSYVLAKMCEKSVRKKPFHIENTNKHQTFAGHCDNENLQRATKETQGMILTYDGKPIVAMFDCCCGGIVPANLEGVDFEKAPYLKRTSSCTFCKRTKLFRWQLSLTVDDMVKALHKKGHTKITDIQELVIKRKDKAGAAKEIAVRSKNQTISLSGKEFYGLFPQIKSFCYSIKKAGRQISFNGNGYGHHLGICQWGAREMVNRGWAFDKILSFFYPSTTLMRLT